MIIKNNDKFEHKLERICIHIFIHFPFFFFYISDLPNKKVHGFILKFIKKRRLKKLFSLKNVVNCITTCRIDIFFNLNKTIRK